MLAAQAAAQAAAVAANSGQMGGLTLPQLQQLYMQQLMASGRLPPGAASLNQSPSLAQLQQWQQLYLQQQHAQAQHQQQAQQQQQQQYKAQMYQLQLLQQQQQQAQQLQQLQQQHQQHQRIQQMNNLLYQQQQQQQQFNLSLASANPNPASAALKDQLASPLSLLSTTAAAINASIASNTQSSSTEGQQKVEPVADSTDSSTASISNVSTTSSSNPSTTTSQLPATSIIASTLPATSITIDASSSSLADHLPSSNVNGMSTQVLATDASVGNNAPFLNRNSAISSVALPDLIVPSTASSIGVSSVRLSSEPNARAVPPLQLHQLPAINVLTDAVHVKIEETAAPNPLNGGDDLAISMQNATVAALTRSEMNVRGEADLFHRVAASALEHAVIPSVDTTATASTTTTPEAVAAGNPKPQNTAEHTSLAQPQFIAS